MNHREFDNARPSQKASMITEGMEYVAWKMEKLAAELKVLNQWINKTPDLIERGENISFDEEALTNARYQLKISSDKFLDQVLLNQDEQKRLLNFNQKLKTQTL